MGTGKIGAHRAVTLSVVVPCYNEREGVAELHRRVSAVCLEQSRSYEIVLVIDGATDGTREAIFELAEKDDHVVAIDGTGGIEVRDEGPGIPAEECENVFEPFYRLQPQSRGAGLGLNLARQIALLHDGTIRIQTGSWRGARIRMELPVRS